MSVVAFRWGSKFFSTTAIERWRLCPLHLNVGELRMLGPIAYDRCYYGIPKAQKRPRRVYLVISGCSVGEAGPQVEVKVPETNCWKGQM